MSNHTPGPWDYVSAEHTAGWGVCVGDGNDLILRMVGRKPKAEKQANARLIAAAPELLEALRAITGALKYETYGPQQGDTLFEGFVLKGVDSWHKAIETIVKATGDEE